MPKKLVGLHLKILLAQLPKHEQQQRESFDAWVVRCNQ